MELTRIRQQRATDEVYSALRQAILTHVFQPGERLNIPDIAGKLGVSLTPVRHAIQALAAEGLISIQPRSGTYVASFTARDIEETFDIRCALECLAAESAVSRITAAELGRLRELLAAMDGEVRDEAHNAEFHGILVRAAGNQKLAEMYEGLKANIQIARVHLAEGYRGARLVQEREEHRRIYEALDARDAVRLQQELRVHIQRAKRSLAASWAAPAGV
ncbi:MAG: GntR family transcriptional regulator [Acidobacteria bacterium]|nr:GntR family transcriptional regulator [Acidobacteriota bacterium]